MKKFICVFLVALLVAGSAFAATPGFRLSPGIGENKTSVQGGQQSDPGKTFRMVRYVPAGGTSISSTLTSESIVIWDLTSDDGVTVTTTTTSPDSAVAGILAVSALTPITLGETAKSDRGRRNWTWLQTHGKAKVRINATNGVTAGNAMGTSATAGEADIFVASATDATKNGNAGFFYDTSAKALDGVECFITTE